MDFMFQRPCLNIKPDAFAKIVPEYNPYRTISCIKTYQEIPFYITPILRTRTRGLGYVRQPPNRRAAPHGGLAAMFTSKSRT